MPSDSHSHISQNATSQPELTKSESRETEIGAPEKPNYAIAQRARIDPRTLSRKEVLELQRTIGNRAVMRLLNSTQPATKAEDNTEVARQEISPVEAEALPERETPQKAVAPRVIQRTEADAIKKAKSVHRTGNYPNWASIVTARQVPVKPIVDNWEKIHKEYTKAPSGSGTLEELYAQADKLTQMGARDWSEPQARREAEHVLNNLVEMSNKLKAAGEKFVRPALAQRINAIQTHFLMPIRLKKAKGRDRSKVGAQLRTKLLLPTGGELELWNKINPETKQPQALGEGGMGYGRHGMFTGTDGIEKRVFVKKQKMKKSEATAAQAFNKPLFGTAQPMQDQYLEYIKEEHDKFKNEMEIAMQLDNENVVKSYGGAISVGKGGQEKAYMLLEILNTDLTKLIKKGDMTEETKLKIMKGALSGLAYVHGKRIIHRDIKPDNIMMDAQGTPKLIDFGEAVKLPEGEDSFTTRTKAGTVGYYHPTKIEQPAAERRDLTYDKSTDLYALKKSFEQMNSTTPGVAAWLDTFDDIDDATTLKNNLEGIINPVEEDGAEGEGGGGEGGEGAPEGEQAKVDVPIG